MSNLLKLSGTMNLAKVGGRAGDRMKVTVKLGLLRECEIRRYSDRDDGHLQEQPLPS